MIYFSVTAKTNSVLKKLNSGRNPLKLRQMEVWYEGVRGLDREVEIYGQVTVKVVNHAKSCVGYAGTASNLKVIWV